MAAPAGSVPVSSVPLTAVGGTVFSQALVAVPTASTAVASATTAVYQIVICNSTSGAITVSISDNQGSPVVFVNGFSIPANFTQIWQLGGIAFTSGIKWNASGVGLTGAILGYQ